MQTSNEVPPLAAIRKLTIMMVERWSHSLEGSRTLLAQLEAEKNIWDRKNWQGHLSASAVVLDNKCESVLFIEHIKLGRYLLPGGHCDSFEMPVATASRELAEETGLGSVLLHPWHVTNHFCPLDLDTHRIPADYARSEPEHLHHDFRYVFILQEEGQAVKISRGEVANYRWHELQELKQDYPRVFTRLDATLLSSFSLKR
jgi:8-oxo-dGTP pyrophosphatase MutT (NUDIX family)